MLLRENRERISCGKGTVFAQGVPLGGGREFAFSEQRGTEIRQRENSAQDVLITTCS